MIPNDVIQKWRLWAEQAIGGSPDRIDAATQAAVAAIDAGESSTDAIVAAARSATLAWDSQQPQRQDDPGTRPAPAKGLVRGRAVAVQQRLEARRFYIVGQGSPPPCMLVCDFRLERDTPDGTPEPPIAVELRSPGSIFRTTKGFEGSVFNGDEIEVDASDYTPGKALQVEQVRNLTSGTIVRERGSSQARIFVDPGAERYGVIRGRATAIQQSQDISNPRILVWTFRLNRTGPDGGSLPGVEIEMRGHGFEGSIAENDDVELDAGGYKAGDVVDVGQVRNFSSNSVVKARKGLFG